MQETDLNRLLDGEDPMAGHLRAMLGDGTGSTKCPLCAKTTVHDHTPLEIICYRNGVKYGRSLGPNTRPLAPTPAMVDEGAQRLVSWDDNCTWPDSWSPLQVAAVRNEAERVWRSMWLASAATPNDGVERAAEGGPLA